MTAKAMQPSDRVNDSGNYAFSSLLGDLRGNLYEVADKKLREGVAFSRNGEDMKITLYDDKMTGTNWNGFFDAIGRTYEENENNTMQDVITSFYGSADPNIRNLIVTNSADKVASLVQCQEKEMKINGEKKKILYLKIVAGAPEYYGGVIDFLWGMSLITEHDHDYSVLYSAVPTALRRFHKDLGYENETILREVDGVEMDSGLKKAYEEIMENMSLENVGDGIVQADTDVNPILSLKQKSVENGDTEDYKRACEKLEGPQRFFMIRENDSYSYVNAVAAIGTAINKLKIKDVATV